MAYHIFLDLVQTIRQSPIRAASAAVLLITTTVYVCTGHAPYRVAEIGDSAPAGEVIDLTADHEWSDVIEQVSTDADEAPAITTFAGGRERYIDAHLTHADAVEDERMAALRTHVEHVSGQADRRPVSEAPVWLIGILSNE